MRKLSEISRYVQSMNQRGVRRNVPHFVYEWPKVEICKDRGQVIKKKARVTSTHASF